MRDIHVSSITDAVKKLCMDANWNLEPDMLRAFDRALTTERSPAGKQVLQILAADGGDPAAIVAERGLGSISDPAALDALIREVLALHPDRVEAYRGGRTGLIGFFVGQVVQRSGGRADPQQVRAALERSLSAG